MNKYHLTTIVKILFISLVISSCSSSPPKPISKQYVTDDGGKAIASAPLSTQRIAEIRQAYIGRSFVFKEDWYEYFVIDSDPLGGFNDLIPISRLADWAEQRGYRKKVTSAGTVAKIVGMRTYRNGITFICKLETGNMAYLTLLNQRVNTILMGRHRTQSDTGRTVLDDDIITIPWVKRNLTYHTVKFIDNMPEVPNVDLTMPEAPQQPTLTAVKGLSSSQPTISQLSIQASPSKLTNNQQLNLLLNYTVDYAGQASTSVTETRTLLFNGKVLPNYPKTTKVLRSNGSYKSEFKLTIPPRAKTGLYVFKGEVCITGDCISRTKQFEVMP